MQTGAPRYRFGSFELDPGRRRLVEAGVRVWLPDRQMDVLLHLVAHAGEVVDKQALIEAAWGGLAVGDNSIVQAIRGLRQTLRCETGGTIDIETHARKGYRLVASIDHASHVAEPIDIDSVLEPFAAFVDGRVALESLNRERIAHARAALEHAVRLDPANAAAHIGLANACFLTFESTRIDSRPDVARLQQAEQHAREGCRLNPASGDAWGTFALVRHRVGDTRQALSAARKATMIEPTPFLHQVRLAMVSWGDERLVAVDRALQRCPELAVAHWLAAAVFVARGTFDLALARLRAGCALQGARQQGSAQRFEAVGLRWLLGLVLAATGDVDQALVELERERTSIDPHHVYAREAIANSWYATGALHLRQCRQDEAAAAFREAQQHVPGHPLAAIALVAAESADVSGSCRRLPRRAPGVRAPGAPAGATRSGEADSPELAIVMAVRCVAEQQHHEAASVCATALANAAPGSAGWILPVEPLLHVAARADDWAPALAALRARAM